MKQHARRPCTPVWVACPVALARTLTLPGCPGHRARLPPCRRQAAAPASATPPRTRTERRLVLRLQHGVHHLDLHAASHIVRHHAAHLRVGRREQALVAGAWVEVSGASRQGRGRGLNHAPTGMGGRPTAAPRRLHLHGLAGPLRAALAQEGRRRIRRKLAQRGRTIMLQSLDRPPSRLRTACALLQVPVPRTVKALVQHVDLHRLVGSRGPRAGGHIADNLQGAARGGRSSASQPRMPQGVHISPPSRAALSTCIVWLSTRDPGKVPSSVGLLGQQTRRFRSAPLPGGPGEMGGCCSC